jgi:predicted nucleotidyltransferase
MQPDLKDRIQKAAKRLMEHGATAVYVFGSVVKGGMRDDSDVDMAVRGLPPSVFFKAMADASRIIRERSRPESHSKVSMRSPGALRTQGS